MSDVEWQIRNWYNFVWLCGDSLVEQAVHSVDKIVWAMNDQPPVSCVGVGGRAVPANGGNIYDHFEVNYLFPNGVPRVPGQPADRPAATTRTHDYMMGTDGDADASAWAQPRIETHGKIKWQFQGEQYDMYQREHDVLFASIRNGKPMNDGKRWRPARCSAIMGRKAAYYGSADHLGSGAELAGEPGARTRSTGTASTRCRGAGDSRASPNGVGLRVERARRQTEKRIRRVWPRPSRPWPGGSVPRRAGSQARPEGACGGRKIRARIEEQAKKTATRSQPPTRSPFRTRPSPTTWCRSRPASSRWARPPPARSRTSSRCTR